MPDLEILPLLPSRARLPRGGDGVHRERRLDRFHPYRHPHASRRLGQQSRRAGILRPRRTNGAERGSLADRPERSERGVWGNAVDIPKSLPYTPRANGDYRQRK